MLKKKNICKISSILFAVASISILFISGKFHDSCKLDNIAKYQADVAKNSTNGGTYLSYYIQNTNKTLPNNYSEFNNLYGTFRQEKATFASIVDPEKEHHIKFKDIECNDLSLFYVGPLGSKEYKNHYKHYIYPLELMFNTVVDYGPTHYVLDISQSQADKYIDFFDLKDIDGQKDYKSLIGKMIDVSVDDKIYQFMIVNIYFEQNYYYDCIHELFDEFAMVAYYFPQPLVRSNVYIYNTYSYQNNYFNQHIKKLYDFSKFEIKLNHNNLNTDVNEELLLAFANNDLYKNSAGFYLIFTASIIFMIFSLFIFFKINGHSSLKFSGFYLISLLLPFVFFYIYKTVFRSYYFWTSFSLICNLSFVALAVLFVLVPLIWKKAIPKEKNRFENYDTIDI